MNDDSTMQAAQCDSTWQSSTLRIRHARSLTALVAGQWTPVSSTIEETESVMAERGDTDVDRM